MGLISFIAGAASASAFHRFTSGVRSVAPRALAGTFMRADAQRYDVALSPAAAARCSALLLRGGGAAALGRAFFTSAAFAPERLLLQLSGVPADVAALDCLAWRPGDRFALWTVLDGADVATTNASLPASALLRLAWVLPPACIGGEQVIEAAVIDNVLSVTLTTGMRRDGAASPAGSLAYAADAVADVAHGAYAMVLARSTAETLRRAL